MAATVQGNIVYLVGGVQLHHELGATSPVILLDLEKRNWVECVPQVGLTLVVSRLLMQMYLYVCQFTGMPPLLHGHTCHAIENTVIILGGGGNCFSFGTALNSSSFTFTV